MRTGEPLEPLTGLDEHLKSWVAEGIISQTQAELITADEAEEAPPGAPARVGLVTEALAYVGGVLVVLAAMLLAARLWPDLSLGVRVALVAAASALLLAVGAAIPVRPGTAGERLRSAAWMLSSAATAFLLGLFASEVLDAESEDVALVVASGSAVYGAALWFRCRTFLQQAVLFVALGSSASSVLARFGPEGSSWEGLPGLGILGLGAVWIYLGAQGRLTPRRLVLVLGGVGTVFGAAVLQQTDWGRVVSLLALAGLIVLALRLADIALLAVGAVGMFLVLPPIIQTWFPGALAAPLALLVAGSLLVLAALRAMRREGAPPTRQR